MSPHTGFHLGRADGPDVHLDGGWGEEGSPGGRNWRGAGEGRGEEGSPGGRNWRGAGEGRGVEPGGGGGGIGEGGGGGERRGARGEELAKWGWGGGIL